MWRNDPKYKELTNIQKVILDIIAQEGPISYDDLFKKYKEVIGGLDLEKKEMNQDLSFLKNKDFVINFFEEPNYYSVKEWRFRDRPEYKTDLTPRLRALLEILDDYGPMSAEEIINKYQRIYLGNSIKYILERVRDRYPKPDPSEIEAEEFYEEGADFESFMVEKTSGAYFTHVTPALNLFNIKPFIHSSNTMNKSTIKDKYLKIYLEFNSQNPKKIQISEQQIEQLVKSLEKNARIIKKYHRDRQTLSAIAHLMLKSELIRFMFQYISKSFKPAGEVMIFLVKKLLQSIIALDTTNKLKNKITLIRVVSSILYEYDKFNLNLYGLKKYRGMLPLFSGRILQKQIAKITVQEYINKQAKKLSKKTNLKQIIDKIIAILPISNSNLINELENYFNNTFASISNIEDKFRADINIVCDFLTDLADETIQWKMLKSDLGDFMKDFFYDMEEFGQSLVGSGALVEKIVGTLLVASGKLGAIKKNINQELFGLIGGLALRIKEILFPEPKSSVSIAKPTLENPKSIPVKILKDACENLKRLCITNRLPDRKITFKNERAMIFALYLFAQEIFASVRKVSSYANLIVEKIDVQPGNQKQVDRLKSLSSLCDNFIRGFNRGNLTGYLMTSTYGKDFLTNMKDALQEIIKETESFDKNNFVYLDPYMNIYKELVKIDFSEDDALIIIKKVNNISSDSDAKNIFENLMKNKKIIKIPKAPGHYRLSKRTLMYIAENPSGTSVDFKDLLSELNHFFIILDNLKLNEGQNHLHAFYCLYDLLKISLEIAKGKIPNLDHLERALNPIVINSTSIQQCLSSSSSTISSSSITMQELLSYSLFISRSKLMNARDFELMPANASDIANFRENIIMLFKGIQESVIINDNTVSDILKFNDSVKKCLELARKQYQLFLDDLGFLKAICDIISERSLILFKTLEISNEDETDSDEMEIDMSFAVKDEEIKKAQYYLQKFLQSIKNHVQKQTKSSTYEVDEQDANMFWDQLKSIQGLDDKSLKEIFNSAIDRKIWRYLPNIRSNSANKPVYKACTLEIPQNVNMDLLELHLFEPDLDKLNNLKKGQQELGRESYLAVVYRLPLSSLLKKSKIDGNPAVVGLFRLRNSNPSGHLRAVINKIKSNPKKTETLNIHYKEKEVSIQGFHYRMAVYAHSDVSTTDVDPSDRLVADILKTDKFWDAISNIVPNWGKSKILDTYLRRINFLRKETAPYVLEFGNTTQENKDELLVTMDTLKTFFDKNHDFITTNLEFNKSNLAGFLTELKTFCLRVETLLPNQLVNWLYDLFDINKFSGNSLRDLSFYYVYFRILEYLLRPDSKQPPFHKLLAERMVSPPRIVLKENGDLCINFIYSIPGQEISTVKSSLRIGYDFGVNNLITSSQFNSDYPPMPYGISAVSTQFDQFCKDRGFEPAFNPFSLNAGFTGFQIIDWNADKNKKILEHNICEQKFNANVNYLLEKRELMRRMIRSNSIELNKALHKSLPSHPYQLHKKILKLIEQKKALWNKIRNTNDHIAKNCYAQIRSAEKFYGSDINIILEDSRTLRGGGLSRSLNYKVSSMVRGQISDLVTNHFHSTPTANSYYHPSAYTSQRCPQCGCIGTHTYFAQSKDFFRELESKAGNYFKCLNDKCIMHNLFELFSNVINLGDIFSALNNGKYRLHKGSNILDTEPLLSNSCPSELQFLWSIIYFINRDRAAACNIARGFKPESELVKNSIIFLRTASKIFNHKKNNIDLPIPTKDYFSRELSTLGNWIKDNSTEASCRMRLTNLEKAIDMRDAVLGPYLSKPAWFTAAYNDFINLAKNTLTVAIAVSGFDPTKNAQISQNIMDILNKPKDIFLNLRQNPPPIKPPIP